MSKKDVGDLTEHVEEIFRSFLPQKYKLHDQGKIIIDAGPEDPPLHQYSEALGNGVYRYTNFDLNSFLKLSTRDQDERILNIIEFSLLDLAMRFSADTKPIEDAADKVRLSGFQLTRTLKISKAHKSRKFKALVKLRYQRGGADVWAELVDDNGTVLNRRDLLTDTWSYEVYHSCHRSKWTDGTFEIFGTGGESTFQIDYTEPIRSRLTSGSTRPK